MRDKRLVATLTMPADGVPVVVDQLFAHDLPDGQRRKLAAQLRLIADDLWPAPREGPLAELASAGETMTRSPDLPWSDPA